MVVAATIKIPAKVLSIKSDIEISHVDPSYYIPTVGTAWHTARCAKYVYICAYMQMHTDMFQCLCHD